MSDLERDVLNLVRLALDGRTADVSAISRRLLRDIGRRRPDLATEVETTLAAVGTRLARARQSPQQMILPVDSDSRLELIRREDVPILPTTPVWTPDVEEELTAIVAEHGQSAVLAGLGILPTRSVLLVGPPGVGKTLAARWLAVQMGLPLLTLDLTAVMSSFLGRTGNNIRVVLDFARSHPSVLLLDEFDALAKRRDDAAEIGELKRLVTVLLQEIDDWPDGGLLAAATNHPDLLDPAVWRRFDRTVRFPTPTAKLLVTAIANLVEADGVDERVVELLAELLEGASYSDATKEIERARRSAAVHGKPRAEALELLAARLARDASRESRANVATHLLSRGWSQRDVSHALGMSRDTIRKAKSRPSASYSGSAD